MKEEDATFNIQNIRQTGKQLDSVMIQQESAKPNPAENTHFYFKPSRTVFNYVYFSG
jgi:hypothetical protein